MCWRDLSLVRIMPTLDGNIWILAMKSLSAHTFSRAALMRWSRWKHSSFFRPLAIRSANLSTWPKTARMGSGVNTVQSTFSICSFSSKEFLKILMGEVNSSCQACQWGASMATLCAW